MAQNSTTENIDDLLQPLTPLEMNNIGFSKKHTVLTPDVLKQMEQNQSATPQ